MARSIRSSSLESRTGRLKLASRWKPYTTRVAPGVRLGYRRNKTAGRWSVIAADGKGGAWLKAFAEADDFETANGESILDFWQAQTRARLLARGEDGKPAEATGRSLSPKRWRTTRPISKPVAAVSAAWRACGYTCRANCFTGQWRC
jgi:hypothetical protein